MSTPAAAFARIDATGRRALNADVEEETMSKEKEPSEETTMARAFMWAIRNGVVGALAFAVAYGLMEIGAMRSSVISQGERQAAYEKSHKADMRRIEAQNYAQNEKLAEHGQALATIQVVLERNEAALERNEAALTRLEKKVDRMDMFLRGDKDSASSDGEGSAKNVSTIRCM